MQQLKIDLGGAVLTGLLPEPGPNGKVNILDFMTSLQPYYSGKPLAPAVEEVIKAIEETMGGSPHELFHVFAEIDKDKNGVLHMYEMNRFLAWLSQRKPEYAGCVCLASILWH